MLARLLLSLMSSISPEVDMPGRHIESTIEILAAYTFLIVREGGLAVSYETDVTRDVALSSVTNPTIDPQSGFKVGGSYISSRWDLSCSYMWFYNKNNTYTRATLPMIGDVNSIYSTWRLISSKESLDENGDLVVLSDEQMLSLGTSLPANSQFVDGLSGNAWNNAFNRVDFTLSRNFSISNYLLLKSFLGLVFAWDEQSWIASYGYISNNMLVMNGRAIGEWNNEQEWYGIGPYVGLCPSLILWQGHTNTLAICGRGGAALTWSRADTLMRFYSGVTPPTEDRDPDLQYRNIFLYVSPMIELFLGLSWESIFYNMWSIRASVGWEIESWFSHNRMFGTNNYPASSGTYSMQGLNVTIGAGF